MPPEDRIPERTERLVVTVGTVWREARVSCPHRDILRAYRDGALDPGQGGYLRFHVEEAECPYCQAQLEDLSREDEAAAAEHLHGLKNRLRSSTITFLRERRAAEG